MIDPQLVRAAAVSGGLVLLMLVVAMVGPRDRATVAAAPVFTSSGR